MCILIERWYICRQDKDLPRVENGESSDPQRPWLGWNHGEPLNDPYENPVFTGVIKVRHLVTTRVRCASWDTRFCDSAPREVFYRIFGSMCPECSGGDRCCNGDKPVATDHVDHETLIQTEEQSQSLDLAVQAYWKCMLRTSSSIIRATINHFPDQPPLFENHNDNNNDEGTLTGPLQDVYHLFASSACCEFAGHVNAEELIPNHCESCSCTATAPGHNLLRSMSMKETSIAMNNEGIPFLQKLQWLERKGYLEQLKASRLQDRIPHESMTPRFILDQPASLPLYSDILAQVCEELISIGEIIEDPEKRDHNLRLDWKSTIENRFCFAGRFLLLLHQDHGLSRQFVQRLFEQHLTGLLAPWIRVVLAASHERLGRLMLYYPPEPEPELESFVSGIDNFDDLDFTLVHASIQEEDQLKDSLIGVREAMRANKKLTNRAARVYVDRLKIIPSVEASSRETTCVLCGEAWFPRANMPKHMRAVEAPCCSKPYHHACFRRLLTNAHERKVHCPMCRDDLTESQGWFRREVNFTPFLKVRQPRARGFIPILNAIQEEGA